MNCHLPILGDTRNNYLNFYKIIDEEKFNDDFLNTSETYTDMQWVLKYYKEDDLIPKEGYINISDYALIHNTKRLPNCGTRISIDTTIFVGDHDVHPDRIIEYQDKIPSIAKTYLLVVTYPRIANIMRKRLYLVIIHLEHLNMLT